MPHERRRNGTWGRGAAVRTLLLIVITALAALSCDEDPAAQLVGRYIYYVHGENFSARELRRHDIVSGADVAVHAGSIVSVSEVAANGRLLLETQSGNTWPPDYHLFVLETGVPARPVPLPVPATSSEEYVYASGRYGEHGSAAISYAGDHVAFFAWKRPMASMDSSKYKLHFCVHDFRSGRASTLDLSGFLAEYYAAQGGDFCPDRPQFAAAALSNDGRLAAMELWVMEMEGGAAWRHRTLLLGGSTAGMHVLEDEAVPGSPGWRRVAFDPAAALLYVARTDQKLMIYDCRGGSREGVFPPTYNIPAFHRLSARSGEYGTYDSNQQRLFLTRPLDAREHDVPFSRDMLEARFPDVQWLLGSHRNCAVSPDGEWITFIADHLGKTCLYAIRRDGSFIRRIACGSFDVPPVVSDVIGR